MNNESFYITLLSNSSMKIYPNNKTSAFTVLLPQKVTLHGKWAVAIAEIHYNYNFFNITREHSQVFIDCVDKKTSTEKVLDVWTIVDGITPGYYTRITDVIDQINKVLIKTIKVERNILSYNPLNGRVDVSASELSNDFKKITFSPRLCVQLGFKPNDDILTLKVSPFAANIHFGIPDQMFVYTDVIEPTFIADEKAYVLKIINTQSSGALFGSSCYKEFERLHYMPVQKREFEAISIDIRDHAGQYMPFLHGVLAVKLHFQKQNG